MAVLFITTGIIGSGKSMIAEFVSKKFNAEILSVDTARKGLLNIKMDEKRLEDYGKGIYSNESREKVYEKLFEIAKEKLKNQKNAIIDASFQKQEQRDKAKDIAFKTGSGFIILYCHAPEEKIKEWLIKRSKEQSVSDGRLELLEDFKKNFDKVEADENTISIDASNEDFLKQTQEKINSKLKSLP